MRPFSIATLILALFLSFIQVVGLAKPLEELVLDLWFRLRGQELSQDDIVLVAIDQRFVEAYPVRIGELDRRFYAKAIEHLAEAGALVIAMDMFFPEQSSDTGADEALAKSIVEHNVILPLIRLSPSAKLGDTIAAQPLLELASQGVLELADSARSFKPIVNFQNAPLASFALATLEAARLRSRHASERSLLIDYRGPKGSFPSLSFLDVYRNQFAYSQIQGKIVLLGVTLEGTDRDQIITPFGTMSGLEVNANQVYTLLHGKLSSLASGYYILILLGLGLLAPFLAQKRQGLLYTLTGIASCLGLSYLAFELHLFISPLSPLLLFITAYIAASYGQLRGLDLELNKKLMQLLDSATLNYQENAIHPDSLLQGFAPKGYVTDAPNMLESLQQGLSAQAGLLILANDRAMHGEASKELLALAEKSLSEERGFSEGGFPYYIAEPLILNDKTVGVLALTLPAPPPAHLQSLFKTSAQTFSQLARYQDLRSQTSTLASTIWPRNSQSSQAKLNALSMIGDLLATERGWLGTLLESLPQAVFIMSPYGYSIYKNASARRLLGNDKNLLKGIPEALDIGLEQFQQTYVTMVEQGESLELGLTERKSAKAALLSFKVIREAGEVKGVAGIVSDLSKLNELDQKRQDMIAMVVHDLRSPLTSIQGFAELLLNDTIDNRQEALDIIHSEASRMRRLTDSFLDISRLESESFKPEKSPSNIADLLRQAVAAISSQARQKHILIELDVPMFLEAKVDADLLSRLMINLLSNALKYSPATSRVYVSLSKQAANFQLVFQDKGYGMDKAQQEQLFQKYKRGSEAKVVGTGLGLYLVKLIVDAHQGTINVQSEPHKGSRFECMFPLD